MRILRSPAQCPARDLDPHHGAFPGRAPDHELAVEGPGPLAHAQEPERLRTGQDRRRDAGPVVVDLEDHVARPIRLWSRHSTPPPFLTPSIPGSGMAPASQEDAPRATALTAFTRSRSSEALRR